MENVNENILSTEYVLYQNKIYSVHDPDTNNEDNKVWCSQLHTSGFWFYREVIRGRSGAEPAVWRRSRSASGGRSPRSRTPRTHVAPAC